MTNQPNGLSNARSSGESVSQFCASDLAQRFSFQPYSESTEQNPVQTCSGRRAVLDKRLLEELYEQMALQENLETRDLILRASDGVVTIEGSTSERAMRARIGNFVRHCRFVRKVVNRMQIRDAACSDGSWRTGSRTESQAAPSQTRALAA